MCATGVMQCVIRMQHAGGTGCGQSAFENDERKMLGGPRVRKRKAPKRAEGEKERKHKVWDNSVV